MTTTQTASILTRAADAYATARDVCDAISLAANDEYADEALARGALCHFLGLPVRTFAENGLELREWAEERTADEVVAALRAAGGGA